MTTRGGDTTYPGGAGATGATTQLARPASSVTPTAIATIHRFKHFILGSPMNTSANPRPQRTVTRLTQGGEVRGPPSHSTAFSDVGHCTRRGQCHGDTPVPDRGRAWLPDMSALGAYLMPMAHTPSPRPPNKPPGGADHPECIPSRGVLQLLLCKSYKIVPSAQVTANEFLNPVLLRIWPFF